MGTLPSMIAIVYEPIIVIPRDKSTFYLRSTQIDTLYFYFYSFFFVILGSDETFLVDFFSAEYQTKVTVINLILVQTVPHSRSLRRLGLVFVSLCHSDRIVIPYKMANFNSEIAGFSC